MNSQELVAKLKSQHRLLQKSLTDVLAVLEASYENKGDRVVRGLEEFKTGLTEHLSLENGTFYPEYMRKKKERGESIEGTEAFILQMDEIGNTVIAFLDKYQTKEIIEEKIEEFGVELRSITSTLNIRIESEEEGVYDFFLIM